MEADEDVVFENSALYRHLQDVGYSKEELQPEKIHRLQTNVTATASNEGKTEKQQAPSFFQAVKDQLVEYVFDESWQGEVRHLCDKSTNQVVEDALKASALKEDDAAYVESFAAALRDEKPEEQSDTMMGQMLTQVGVLGVTMGYGFFRMFYMKSPDLSTCLFFYALDILSVVMTVVALLPATIKFAVVGRLVGRHQSLNDAAALLLTEIENFQRLTKKAKVFIRETELIKRGFTMMAAPISRLESGLQADAQRQCPVLRRAIFRHARSVTQDFRDTTLKLFACASQSPLWAELDQASAYVSRLELSEYGPHMTIEDGDELAAVTENFCLDSLKSVVEIMDIHISEFIRVLCLLCLVQSRDYSAAVKGFPDQLEAVQWLSQRLKENQQPIQNCFILHKQLEVKMADVDSKNSRQRTPASSPARALHLAVHSLRMHLLAAAQRLQSTDEKLESLTEFEVDLQLDNASDRLQLAADLKAVGNNLSACKNCYEELSGLLFRQQGKVEEAAGTDDKPCDAVLLNDASAEAERDVVVIPDQDPVSEDQVFEGFTDEADDLSLKNGQPLPEDEEKCTRHEAVHVLAELKTVIAVRAEEMQRREEAALMKMETTTSCKKTAVGNDISSETQDSLPCSISRENGVSFSHEREDGRDLSTESEELSKDSGINQSSVSSTEINSVESAVIPNSNCNVRAKSDGVSSCQESDASYKKSEKSATGPLKTEQDSESMDAQSSDFGSDLDAVDLRMGGGLFNSIIARLAVAKSSKMAALNVDTFGDDSSEEDASDSSDSV